MRKSTLSICAVLGAMAITSASACSQSAEAPKKETQLNSYLTNELSDTTALAGLDRKVEAFMAQWQLKGASLAVMRNDSLMYAKGYGWADEAAGITMEPYHLLRLASVSKLITATGIMVLQDEGKLSIKDKVFGEGGILADEPYSKSIKDANYYKITVEHLLRHKGGFYAGANDPMFSTRNIMSAYGLTEAPDNDKLLECVLRRKLNYMPGSTESYSNLGYLILSKVIEKASGMSYEEFIQEKVFRPSGIEGFHIANNYYKDRHDNEVRYYVQANEAPVQEYNNSGKMVTRCYGGNDIHNLSGAGAWVASVPELMKFVASIDGQPEIPDIISRESYEAMVEYFDEKTFSLGWNDTKPESGFSRSGSFSGTSAMIRYFPDGECWIMVTNTSNWKASSFSRTIASFFSDMRRSYSKALPQRDFFHVQ